MRLGLYDFLFGCTHSNRSFPRTVRPSRRVEAARLTGTYVVCLDCGREFPCSMDRMRVVSEKDFQAPRCNHQVKEI
jgi:hypothetical protein